MKIYQVGGSVRDNLLGRTPKDLDYVVVGSNPEEMLSLGYTQVGSHFPVFIHPETKEEYALARTERATGAGHIDFECTTEGVTLEADLSRRDLTINAMAVSLDDSTLHDPFGGRSDLGAKLLRHVSDAFEEDPVRILRVARFAAQLNFGVAEETLNKMTMMVFKGALESIPIERIKGEFDKAVMSGNLHRFLEILHEVCAIEKLQYVFDLETEYLPPLVYSKDDDYDVRIIKIALAYPDCSTPFPNKLLIGAKLHKLTEYISSISALNISAGFLEFYPEELLPYMNQTLGQLIKFMVDKRIILEDNSKSRNLEVLIDIYKRIKLLKFADEMTIGEITQMKLNVVTNKKGYMLHDLINKN